MASERLQVILDMETGAYRREAKKAADSTKEIGASAQQTGDKVGGFGAKLNSIGPAAAAGIVATAGVVALQVGRIVSDLDQMAIAADSVRDRFDTIFGESADDMREWADEVNSRFGDSEVAVQNLANSVGDLLVPLGFTREEAALLSQEALTVANALSEWTGGQVTVERSAEAVRKALLGEREMLKELGTAISEADVSARLLAKGQEDLTGEERKRAKALATLELIQENSTDALSAYEDGTNEALIAQKNLNAAFADGEQALADFIKKEVDDARDAIPLLVFVLEDLTNAMAGATSEAGDTEEETQSLTESILKSIPFVNEAAESLIPLAENYARAKVEAAEAKHEIRGSGSSAGEAARPMADLADEAGGAATEMKRLADNSATYIDTMAALLDPVSAATSAMGRYLDAQAKVDELVTAGEEGTREWAEAQVDLADATADAQAALNDLDGVRGPQALSDLLQIPLETAREILEVLGLIDGTQVNAVINITERINRSPGQVIRDIEGGDSTAPIINPRDFPFPRRAMGGAIDPLTPTVVGENGIEVVVSSSPGHVIPNHQLIAPNVTHNYISVAIDGATYGGDPAAFAKGIAREMDQALGDLRGGTV